jgi:hypothetical protein
MTGRRLHPSAQRFGGTALAFHCVGFAITRKLPDHRRRLLPRTSGATIGSGTM